MIESIEFHLSVEHVGGHPTLATVFGSDLYGAVLEQVAQEQFGPFDTWWDVAHWLGVVWVRQSPAPRS